MNTTEKSLTASAWAAKEGFLPRANLRRSKLDTYRIELGDLADQGFTQLQQVEYLSKRHGLKISAQALNGWWKRQIERASLSRSKTDSATHLADPQQLNETQTQASVSPSTPIAPVIWKQKSNASKEVSDAFEAAEQLARSKVSAGVSIFKDKK